MEIEPKKTPKKPMVLHRPQLASVLLGDNYAGGKWLGTLLLITHLLRSKNMLWVIFFVAAAYA